MKYLMDGFIVSIISKGFRNGFRKQTTYCPVLFDNSLPSWVRFTVYVHFYFKWDILKVTSLHIFIAIFDFQKWGERFSFKNSVRMLQIYNPFPRHQWSGDKHFDPFTFPLITPPTNMSSLTCPANHSETSDWIKHW